MVDVSSPIMCGVHAFIFSGRLSVILRTASRCSTMICSGVLTPGSSQCAGGWGEPGKLSRWTTGSPPRSTSARIARLGTVDADGAVRLVPVCFAVVEDWVVSAVDHKPKRTGQLRRLDDMRATGSATVLIDHYDEDWSQLWWVRVRGRAEVLTAGAARDGALDALVDKYAQYREHRPAGDVWRVATDELRWWRSAD